jgi:hypothetical protein
MHERELVVIRRARATAHAFNIGWTGVPARG